LKVNDTYQQWEVDGILEQKLKTVQELAAKRIIQKEIAECLNITEKTLIKIKKDHPRLNQAFLNGDAELKEKLIDAVFQKAVGFEYEEVQTIIEEVNGVARKKIAKTKKRALPDFNAIKYLLIIKFGRDYNEKKEELDLLQKRLERGEEVWLNADYNEEHPAAKRVREQSKRQREGS
jgi:DNA-binding XRE family transcriptional regulator